MRIAVLMVGLALHIAAKFIPANDTHIQYRGRRVLTGGSVEAEWPGFRVTVSFTGTSAVAHLHGGVYEVYINKVNTSVINAGSDKNYTVASGLPDNQVHTLSLRLRYTGTSAFKGLYLDDGSKLANPPPLPTRKLETLGDSEGTGYGTLCEGPCSGFGSFLKQYAYVTAEHFGAQINAVAKGGAGILRSGNNIPSVYPYAYESQKQNFSSYQPDGILINLGPDDYSEDPTFAGWQEAYLKFLDQIRVLNPHNPWIFVTCGPLPGRKGLSICSNTTQVVAKQNAKGDNRTVYVDMLRNGTLWNYSDPRIYGCDSHPSAYGHQLISDRLNGIIGPILGWGK